MDNKEFKTLFSRVAGVNGFEKNFDGWFKETPECIVVLELQKSNYGNYYQLNIKVYVQGMFGKDYTKSKDLVKKEVGHIRSGEPQAYRDIFNFDRPLEDDIRKEKLEELFAEHIGPFVDKSLTRAGIRHLEETGKISLLPAVKQQLELLN